MGNTDFSLHDRIISLRTRHGLSQGEMADAAGIAPRTYQNIEYKRTKDIPISHIAKIAKAMGMTIDELVNGEKQSPSKEMGLRRELNKLVVGLPDSALPDAIHRMEILRSGLKNDKAPSRSTKE